MNPKVKLLIEVPKSWLETLRLFEKDCPDGLSRSDKVILVGKRHEEPMTGKWIVERDCEGKTRKCRCDRCDYETGNYTWKNPNFCPNCGAKMESEDEE